MAVAVAAASGGDGSGEERDREVARTTSAVDRPSPAACNSARSPPWTRPLSGADNRDCARYAPQVRPNPLCSLIRVPAAVQPACLCKPALSPEYPSSQRLEESPLLRAMSYPIPAHWDMKSRPEQWCWAAEDPPDPPRERIKVVHTSRLCRFLTLARDVFLNALEEY